MSWRVLVPLPETPRVSVRLLDDLAGRRSALLLSAGSESRLELYLEELKGALDETLRTMRSPQCRS